MRGTVEVLLIIGILVNLIKGADLILRPHQQKWLQMKADSLALRLDYTKPLEWYTKHSGRRIFWVIYVIAPAVFFVGALVILNFMAGNRSWLLYLVIFCLVFMVLSCATTVGKGDWEQYYLKKEDVPKMEKLLTGWLLSSRTFIQQLFKHILITIAAAVCLLFTYFCFKKGWGYAHLLYPEENDSLSIKSFGRLLLFLLSLIPFLLLFRFLAVNAYRFGIVSLCVVIFSLIMLAIEIPLKVVRGVAWRVAEFNRGAFAALVLIITIALGITELYLKTRGQ